MAKRSMFMHRGFSGLQLVRSVLIKKAKTIVSDFMLFPLHG